MELAARQLNAAADARGTVVPQCVVTDQIERSRPHLVPVPLRTTLDAAPFLSRCERYTTLFDRPCKLLFGYMAKAIAAARAPYSTTIFLDTDTFVCDAALLVTLGTRLMASYDALLLLPRTSQGWTNSGVLAVRRESSRGWAMAWQHEFISLDDFGDQLHLLKVLPSRSAEGEQAGAGQPGGSVGDSTRDGGNRGRKGAGGGGHGGERGALALGELPPELHVRVGNIPTGVAVKLPALRGPAMLLHSKGLAALAETESHVAARFAGTRGRSALGPAQQQLVAVIRDGEPELKRKGEHALYSGRALAGICAMLNEGWADSDFVRPPALRNGRTTRQLVLNSKGNCTGCKALPRAAGSVGVIVNEVDAAGADEPFLCTPAAGSCGVRTAVWPDGSERGLPEWYRRWLQTNHH